MKIEILFEDSYILVVNKPANVLIHNSYYARNIKEPTLLDLLKLQTHKELYPIHRLDRKTSGVLVLAKQKEYVFQFQELFNANAITKTYLAIVRGFFEMPKIVNSPVKNPDTKVYKDAETFCEPLLTKLFDKPVHPYSTSRYSLIKLTPSTGRMHQLRIHMNKISHPIVGDYKYGDRFHNRMFETEFGCYNMFLHANTLQFTHPKTGNYLCFKAAIPKNWSFVFSEFNWKINL